MLKSPKTEDSSNQKYGIRDGHFIYKDGHMFERVPIDQLLYVEGSGNYFTMYFQSRKVMLKGTLSVLFNELPTSLFLKVNRSIIVSVQAVKSFNSKRVILHTGQEFSVSKAQSEDMLSKLLG